MSLLLSLFGGIWGKTVTIIVAVVTGFAALAGIRYRIRKGAQDELSNKIQRKTMEKVERAKKIDIDAASVDDDDILERLRDNGWIR